nr:putative ribonuclease h protein [Quercus suber]
MNRPFSEDWVWKVAAIPKINFLLWQCSYQSILIRAILAKKRNDIVFGKSSTPKDLNAETLAKAAEMAYLGIAKKLRKSRTRIQLCISLKVPVLAIELDAKLVVELLKKDVENPNGISVLVADCREGLKEIPMVRIQHCYREANKCADALAHRGVTLKQDFTIFIDPPSNVAFLLNLDSVVTCYFCDVASGLEAF